MAGVVEQRVRLSIAVDSGIEGIPVPREGVESPLSGIGSAEVYRFPPSVTLGDAHVWYDTLLPQHGFRNWVWCGKREYPDEVDWRWYRGDDTVPDSLVVLLGEEDNGEAYVLIQIVEDDNPQTCHG